MKFLDPTLSPGRKLRYGPTIRVPCWGDQYSRGQSWGWVPRDQLIPQGAILPQPREWPWHAVENSQGILECISYSAQQWSHATKLLLSCTPASWFPWAWFPVVISGVFILSPLYNLPSFPKQGSLTTHKIFISTLNCLQVPPLDSLSNARVLEASSVEGESSDFVSLFWTVSYSTNSSFCSVTANALSQWDTERKKRQMRWDL